MARVNSRTTLDEHLNDEDLVLLLLAGGNGTSAKACHDLWIGGVRRPEQVAVELIDLSILTAAESAEWFGDAGAEHYAVRNGVNGSVTQSGPVSDLLRSDGSPSIQKLMAAFRSVG